MQCREKGVVYDVGRCVRQIEKLGQVRIASIELNTISLAPTFPTYPHQQSYRVPLIVPPPEVLRQNFNILTSVCGASLEGR